MALTVAVLAFLYCFGVVLLTHFLAERLRANPRIATFLEKMAGVFLIAFGLRLAATR
jgi:threonine/homoserine/homoserine lactone efflux protein